MYPFGSALGELSQAAGKFFSNPRAGGRVEIGGIEVEVVRSARRRKTVELKPTAKGVRVTIPASASLADEHHYVTTLLRRYQRKRNRPAIDLAARARQLANNYSLSVPSSIEWVDNQSRRWGSCTPGTRSIRISSSVGKFPSWVIDYVIIHELVHLDVFGHGPDFWQRVERYPMSERARGFLIAKSDEDSENIDDDNEVLE